MNSYILLILSIFLGYSSTVFAGPLKSVKIQIDRKGHSEMATGFFVDFESNTKTGFYNCEPRSLKIVTANNPFKNLSSGTKALVIAQFEKGPNTSLIKYYKAKTVMRDYFSQSTILELDSSDDLIGDANRSRSPLKCVGLNASKPGKASFVGGFSYEKIILQGYSLDNANNRGLSSGLVYDRSKSPIGTYSQDYFSQDPANEMSVRSFNDLRSLIVRVNSHNFQSSKGVFYYFPEHEEFAVLGSSAQFVVSSNHSLGEVEILGAPYQVARSNDLRGRGRGRDNAFKSLGILKSIFGGARFYLEKVNGRDASNWKFAEKELTQLRERTKPVFGYSVRTGDKSIRLLAGNKYLEDLSDIVVLTSTNKALYDREDKMPARPFNAEELAIARRVSTVASRILDSLFDNSSLSVINDTPQRAKMHFSLLGNDFAQLRNLLFDGDNPKFDRRESATMFKIQQLIIGLDNWLTFRSNALGNPTVTDQWN